MNCAFHPEAKAESICTDCQKPLCEACLLLSKSREPLCSGCTARRAAGDMLKDVQERGDKQEAVSRERVEKLKKKVVLYRTAFIVLALVVAAANLILYLNRAPIQGGESFIPSEHPLSTAVLVDAAVRDYAEDHQGAFPQSLKELVGPYLSPEVFQPADLSRFSYKPIPPSGYELRSMENKGQEETEEFVFSEKGIQ